MAVISVDHLARFTPASLVSRLLADPTPLQSAAADNLQGAVMFADITGFSRMTEILSARPDGAERINAALNGYLGKLIEMVIDHGGDVIKFAGDALICIWDGSGIGLSAAVRASAACALRAQKELAGFTVDPDITLSMRICIGSGDLTLLHVGGVLERWEIVPTGAAVADLKKLRQLTSPGSTVVSANAWTHLGAPFTGRVAPKLAADGKTTMADLDAGTALLEAARNTPFFAAGDKAMRLSWNDNLPRAEPMLRAPVRPGAETAMRMFVPSVVLTRLSQGMSEWLSELRRVTVLFATLPGGVSEKVDVHHVQAMVAAMQKAIYRYDGAINKISVDEKGAVLIAVFGLPPLSHEDDAARAVQAAMAMRKSLMEGGVSIGVGVASGQVFCGTVGNNDRCEYTVLGPTVNLAARLMEASEGKLWCDDPTAQLASATLEMQRLGAIDIRGRTEQAVIWAPTGNVRAAVKSKTVMVGRQKEREALGECIQAVVRAHQSSVAMIIGEAGIGKSRLLDDFERQAESVGMQVLKGAGDAIDRNAPYHPWRNVFAEVLGILPSDDTLARGARVDAFLASFPDKIRLLKPLLEVVLAADLGDDDAVKHLSGEARAQQTQKLLAAILQQVADKNHTAIIVEDAHWFDSASWSLFRSLRLNVTPLMWVVASRPMDDPPQEFIVLQQDPDIKKLRLGPLSRDDAGNLACQRLGVKGLPSEVIDLIAARADGNALFVEELALVLRDTKSIIVQGDETILAVPIEQLAHIELPATVEGLIVSRIDALEVPQQMALKVASVVGRQFAVETVQDVFPLPEHRRDVPKMMPNLVLQELIRDSEVADQYLFKHVLTQEAVYGLMLFGQRRGLHRAVAEWYERRHGDDISHYLPILAHHWQRAEEWSRALACLERAAEQNLDRYANHEAVELLKQALALDKAHPEQSTDDRRAHWHRHLTEAWFRLGHLDLARDHGRAALGLLGRAVPTSLAGTVLGLLKQVGLRALQRWMPQRFAVTTTLERHNRIWTTRVLNRLTEVFIYAEDAAGCLYSGLRELNDSEPAGNSPELGKAYAVMAVVLGSVPQLRGLAKAWAERAVTVTEAAPNANAALAYVLSRVAIVDLYDAHWTEGEAKLRRAAEVARTSGDRRLREEAVAVLAILQYYAGRFSESMAGMEQLKSSAHFSNNVQIQAWSRFGMASILLRTKQPQDALAQLREVKDWVQKQASKSEVLWAIGLEVLALMRSGDLATGETLADTLLPYIQKRPVAYWVQPALAALAETYLMLLEGTSPNKPQYLERKRKARIACLAMHRFGNAFPFGKPQALLWDGLRHQLNGKPATALKCWHQCIAIADKQRMPWEAALAHREIGRHLPVHDPRRNDWLDKAVEKLEVMGASWDLELADRSRWPR
ncbi:MAG: adenylate/guanylate cyclase domain-containing protein [Myxococcales bacterium]|nr:adenylate/guanylate cyclase domain-containing protein [Myxococcales bacterium]